MFTLTVFEILLFEDRMVLSPVQWGAGSERVKGSFLQRGTGSERVKGSGQVIQSQLLSFRFLTELMLSDKCCSMLFIVISL